MKLKKAILAPEVLKILIAVLCIVILMYLAFQLYGVFTVKSDNEKASVGLDAIIGKAKALLVDEKAQYLINGPKGWGIIKIEEPSACSGGVKDSCLCFCANIYGDVNENLENCKSAGVCKIFNNFEVNQEGSRIPQSLVVEKVPFTVLISNNSNKILITPLK